MLAYALPKGYLMPTIQQQIDLTHLNTLRLCSKASHYTVLTQLNALPKLQQAITQFPKFFVLGGGSNLILPEHYQGLVIHNQLRGIEISLEEGKCMVTAMAGEPWDDFVAYCCRHGAYGLENLSLIPGTVGAAPIQNIGAYGVEVKELIHHVTAYDFERAHIVTLTNAACQFRYRHSMLKNNPRYLVLSVTFQLATKPGLNLSYGDVAQHLSQIAEPTPTDLRQTIINIRQSKLPDPNQLGNVGSFFHNPIIPIIQAQALSHQYPKLPTFDTEQPAMKKISAGWLIDNLGLKGLRRGNIGIYPKQALVLINYGMANQTELLEFAAEIQKNVRESYQIQLNIEPIILD